MKLKIQSQGNYEGSCFLYSIVNAYGALTGKNFTQKAWDKRVGTIPFQAEFTTSRGTTLYNDELSLYLFAINRMLNEYDNGSFLITPIENISSGKMLADAIGADSVLILNIDSDHWVCAVDHSIEQGRLFIACSSQLFEQRASYSEDCSPTLHRIYNREEPLGKGSVEWLYNSLAIKITRI